MAKNILAPDRDAIGGAAKVVVEAGQWNYEASVERVSLIVTRWNRVTLELARELYFAHEYLASQLGQYKNPDAADYIPYTWSDYCDAVGIARPTANKWAKLFVPGELSSTGEDRLLTAEDIKAPPPPALTGRQQERRIALVMNGGPRPDDWTREEERIVKERQSKKRIEELTHVWIEKQFDYIPQQDYFKSILAKTKTVKKFQLKSKEQSDAQYVMFDAIDGYLKMFPDKESRLAAAANLTAQIHDVVNYLIERDIVQAQSQPED
ncbi:MAG: hypothetical protein LBN21_13015 [Treponema sp.]|jgi:hypothetical protein|nr:hypothetical protein [Treponema sp.]